MKLKAWMTKYDLRVAPIAELLGVSVDAVYSWLNMARRVPRPATMKRIRSLTGGKVSYRDFAA